MCIYAKIPVMKPLFLIPIFLINVIFPVHAQDDFVFCMEQDGKIEIESSRNGKCADDLFAGEITPLADTFQDLHSDTCQDIPLCTSPPLKLSAFQKNSLHSLFFPVPTLSFEKTPKQTSVALRPRILKAHIMALLSFHHHLESVILII
jgi:hypothetical protein